MARAGGGSVQCPELSVMADTDDGDLATTTSGAIALSAPVPKSHSHSDVRSVSSASSLSAAIASGEFDMGAYRKKILSQSAPHIIECAEAGEGGSQDACHLSRDKRFAALEQKGITLWMTGLSGSGKSTIASLLEEQLVLGHGKSV